MQPKTIEELRQWYIDHNLPPEEVTRFFIGKNIREPKAFGIYEEDGVFVVYKNKDTGERYIRYRGSNEAKAVKELLDRLKQEILNQKALNGHDVSASRTKNRKSAKLVAILCTLAACVGLLLFVMVPFTLWSIEEKKKPESFNYYYLDDDNFFFYYGYHIRTGEKGRYQWYKYSFEQGDWAADVSFEKADAESYPNGIDKDTVHGSLYTLKDYLGEDYEKYNIHDSHAYIDDDHHYTPDEGYYDDGNHLYYYLDDKWGSSYGDGNNSGWYQFDGNNWSYYASYDDKKILNDNLWYRCNDYYLGSNYSYLMNQNGVYEGLKDFGSTDWYKKEKAAEEAQQKAYEKRQEEKSKSNSIKWDDDNDYNWDSGDTWSSDSTDWSSDW